MFISCQFLVSFVTRLNNLIVIISIETQMVICKDGMENEIIIKLIRIPFLVM